MKRNQRPIGLAILAGGALLTLSTGCSGINASHSVSPASFFLPGLIRVEPAPAPATPAPAVAEPVLVARSR